MLIETKDLSEVRKSIEIEVPVEAVAEETRKVIQAFQRKVRVPGFRPGKVPDRVVLSRHGKEIREEVVEHLINHSFSEAVREKGLEMVGEPVLKRVDDLTDGTPFRFEAELEVKPSIEVGEYRGLRLTASAVDADDKAIEAKLDSLRDQAATFRPIEDRGAADGDYAVIDIERTAEDLEPAKTEGGHVLVGEDSPLPEMHEALQGKRPGDTFSFTKTFLHDAPNEELNGKTVLYQVTVKELRNKERPELTDDFAKSLGWESAEAIRENVVHEVKAHAEHEAADKLRKQAVTQLVDRHVFEVPDALVDEQVVNALRSYARYLESMGVDVEKAPVEWEKLREEFRPEGVRRVRENLILEKIARNESLMVADAVVDAEIRRAAVETGREFNEVKGRLRRDGGYEGLRVSLSRDKALGFVIENALIDQGLSG